MLCCLTAPWQCTQRAKKKKGSQFAPQLNMQNYQQKRCQCSLSW